MNESPSSSPPPWSWRDDQRLISAISVTNPKLGRYALHLLDLDAQRVEERSVEEEAELGAAVVSIGQQLLRRAEVRSGRTSCEPELPGPVVEGSVDELGDER